MAENQLCGFDCASPSEINLALASIPAAKDDGGLVDAARRCVYANPQRDRAALDAALARGVEALTFDGSEELGKVREAHDRRCRRWAGSDERDVATHGIRSGGDGDDRHHAGPRPPPRTPPHPPEMILRLLVPDATSSVPLGEKFGAPPGMIASLAEEAVSLGLPVIGVSFHCGSGCHDADAFGTAVRLAADALRVVNEVLDGHGLPRCNLLDIGGGYPGVDGVGGDLGRFSGRRSAFDDEEAWEAEAEADRGGKGGTDDTDEKKEEAESGGITTAAIASVVTPLLDELFPPPSQINVISEPGRYFVEGAFALCSRIYSTRTEVDLRGAETRRHYYIAQGVQGVFKDVLLCGESFVPIPLRMVVDDDDCGRGGSGETGKVRLSSTTELCGESMAGAPGSPPQPLVPSTVHGPSGEDFDVVCPDCALPRLERGDFLLFDRMGAYTLSIAARGGGPPVRYVVGGCGVGGR